MTSNISTTAEPWPAGSAQDDRTAPPPSPTARAAMTAEDPDQSEAAVQALLVTFLTHTGWRIQRVADTAAREQGIDIRAFRAGRTLAVEVKGYPGRTYADARRAGEPKPTNPSTQARHWFAGALLKAVLIREEHPDFDIAMAFPDMHTYRNLARRCQSSLAALSIIVYFVTPDGQVQRVAYA